MNIFKLGLSFTMYMLYMTMNINKYLKMLGEFAYTDARCMLVKRLLTNMLCGSGKIEILSSCTKLVCCLARSLNARSLRQQ